MAATTFTANLDKIDTSISLYIPVVHQSVANFEYIQKVFHEKNFGWVYRVDFVPCKGNTKLLSAFVYLDWYKTNVVCYLQELIIVPDPRIQAKIFHSNDIKYFWVIIKNRNPKILKEMSVSTTENEELKKKVSELKDYVAELEDKLLNSLNYCHMANEERILRSKTIEKLTLELNSIKKTNDCIPDLYEENCELYEINRKLTIQLNTFKQQGSYQCTKCDVRVENIDGDIQSETCAKQLCLRCFMDS